MDGPCGSNVHIIYWDDCIGRFPNWDIRGYDQLISIFAAYINRYFCFTLFEHYWSKIGGVIFHLKLLFLIAA